MFINIKIYKTPVTITGVLFFLSTHFISLAQNDPVQNDFEHRIFFFDHNGKSFVNANNNVGGTPFFNENWGYGKIIVNENSISNVFSNVKLRLNIQTQQVHFLRDNIEMVIPGGLVREITLFDSSKKIPVVYTFQYGFTSIDNQNEKNFYEVLSNGKIKFLKSLRKKMHEEKDGFSGEVRKEFRQYEDYYFFADNKLERIKRDKNFVLGYMKDKNNLINDFLQKNKISCKSTDDIKKIVDYYNSLF